MTLKNTDVAQHNFDLKFMKLAINLALEAEKKGEVPVGALVVDKNGKIVSKAMNARESLQSVLGHAELIALHRANKKLRSWRLNDCTLYVTLEPCFMCGAALVQSRISRVVFATPDPKGGALGSLERFFDDKRLNHQFQVSQGPFTQESSQLLKSFFNKRRQLKK